MMLLRTTASWAATPLSGKHSNPPVSNGNRTPFPAGLDDGIGTVDHRVQIRHEAHHRLRSDEVWVSTTDRQGPPPRPTSPDSGRLVRTRLDEATLDEVTRPPGGPAWMFMSGGAAERRRLMCFGSGIGSE
jgi:hypothetical protein